MNKVHFVSSTNIGFNGKNISEARDKIDKYYVDSALSNLVVKK